MMLYYEDSIKYDTNISKLFSNLLSVSDVVSCTCSVLIWSDVDSDIEDDSIEIMCKEIVSDKRLYKI